jgi:hypothetical protein
VRLLGPALLGVRIGGMVLAIRAIVCVMLMGNILVMPRGHALPRADRGHPLDRDGQSQQDDRKKSEESSRHRRAL